MSEPLPKANKIRVPGSELNKRWVRPTDLSVFWNYIAKQEGFNLEMLGNSHEGRSIYTLDWGHGKKKLMAWSQMHGNEATATLSLIDLCEDILNGKMNGAEAEITLRMIIMLNPDGAERFTRRNALGIDLNRDVLSKSAAETRLFFKALEDFRPDWAFNMHDQRSIFSAGESSKTATLSFLAPSEDFERRLTPGREEAMKLSAFIHQGIEHLLPGHFGRYTDEFYPRALGDNLMKQGIPNILFEAGAFPSDPTRLKARQLLKEAVIKAMEAVAEDSWQTFSKEAYLGIPENKQNLRDLVFRRLDYRGINLDLALMKVESVSDELEWQEYYVVDDIGDLSHMHGIEEYDSGTLSAEAVMDIGRKAHFTLNLKRQEFRFKNGQL